MVRTALEKRQQCAAKAWIAVLIRIRRRILPAEANVGIWHVETELKNR
jgi:hypothetical protein